jgi:branched-subunit amino acid ABC-type transport system permease component
MAVQCLLTLAIVTPLGPLVYRLAYQPLADATVLVLLIVSVGVHFALTGLGLRVLRCRGLSQPELLGRPLQPRPAHAVGQTLIIFLVSIVLIASLWLLLRAHAARQGLARDRGQPAGCAADGHLDHGRGSSASAWRLHRCAARAC